MSIGPAGSCYFTREERSTHALGFFSPRICRKQRQSLVFGSRPLDGHEAKTRGRAKLIGGVLLRVYFAAYVLLSTAAYAAQQSKAKQSKAAAVFSVVATWTQRPKTLRFGVSAPSAVERLGRMHAFPSASGGRVRRGRR